MISISSRSRILGDKRLILGYTGPESVRDVEEGKGLFQTHFAGPPQVGRVVQFDIFLV